MIIISPIVSCTALHLLESLLGVINVVWFKRRNCLPILCLLNLALLLLVVVGHLRAGADIDNGNNYMRNHSIFQNIILLL
jgi:hypothetical protein